MQTHTSDSSSEFEAVESDGVLRLTIQRESRRNAINPAVMTGLAEALSQANANRSLRAIVLTGAGDKAFCAGADLHSGQSFSFDYAEPTQGFANLLRVSRQLTVPLVARVNGACMAGGMGLMAMCDLAVPHRTPSSACPKSRWASSPRKC